MQELVQDLKTIGAMQRRLLPHTIPQPAGWSFAAHHQIGAWPGGNYYDFLPLADGRVVFLLADASDRGGPATALAAMLRVFLHSCPLTSGQEQTPYCPIHGEVVQAPHIALGNLNQVIMENSLHEQSVSAFCGVLSPVEGTFHFANAGHPSPRWWRARTRTVEALRFAVGLPLGMDANATYHHKRIDIEPGDVLVFYTSGIIVADPWHEFDLERLDATLKESARDGVVAVKDTIVSRWQERLGKNWAQDDATVIVMKRSD
jgi:sigma-B regulation protein RsbU (phosphoserine phosphatase)